MCKFAMLFGLYMPPLTDFEVFPEIRPNLGILASPLEGVKTHWIKLTERGCPTLFFSWTNKKNFFLEIDLVKTVVQSLCLHLDVMILEVILKSVWAYVSVQIVILHSLRPLPSLIT